jgi:hypothetical protein
VSAILAFHFISEDGISFGILVFLCHRYSESEAATLGIRTLKRKKGEENNKKKKVRRRKRKRKEKRRRLRRKGRIGKEVEMGRRR